jgi:hypothetical protein
MTDVADGFDGQIEIVRRTRGYPSPKLSAGVTVKGSLAQTIGHKHEKSTRTTLHYTRLSRKLRALVRATAPRILKNVAFFTIAYLEQIAQSKLFI